MKMFRLGNIKIGNAEIGNGMAILIHCSVCYHHVLLLTGEDDLQEVRSAVADLAGKWKDLGISLGIRFSDLDAIHFPSPSECLREMLAMWLRQKYNVRTTLIVSPASFIMPSALAWHLKGQVLNV